MPPERTFLECTVVYAVVALYFYRWSNGDSGFTAWHPDPNYTRTLDTADYVRLPTIAKVEPRSCSRDL